MGSKRSAARRCRVSFLAMLIRAQKSVTLSAVLTAALLAVSNRTAGPLLRLGRGRKSNVPVCAVARESPAQDPGFKARNAGPLQFCEIYLILASLNTTCLR